MLERTKEGETHTPANKVVSSFRGTTTAKSIQVHLNSANIECTTRLST